MQYFVTEAPSSTGGRSGEEGHPGKKEGDGGLSWLPAMVCSHENRVLVGDVEITLVSEHEPWPLMEEKLHCLGRHQGCP